MLSYKKSISNPHNLGLILVLFQVDVPIGPGRCIGGWLDVGRSRALADAFLGRFCNTEWSLVCADVILDLQDLQGKQPG